MVAQALAVEGQLVRISGRLKPADRISLEPGGEHDCKR